MHQVVEWSSGHKRHLLLIVAVALPLVAARDWATPPITSDTDPNAGSGLAGAVVVKDHWSETVVFPRPDPGRDIESVDCPHAPGTTPKKRFDDPSAWVGGTLPRQVLGDEPTSGARVQDYTHILVEANAVNASAVYEHITIPPGSSLVFADEPLHMHTRGFTVEAGRMQYPRDVLYLCRAEECITMEQDGALVVKSKPASTRLFDSTYKWELVPSEDGLKEGYLNRAASRLLVLSENIESAYSKLIVIRDDMTVPDADAFTTTLNADDKLLHMDFASNAGRFLSMKNGQVTASAVQALGSWNTFSSQDLVDVSFNSDHLPGTLAPNNPEVGLCSFLDNVCLNVNNDRTVGTAAYTGGALSSTMTFQKVTFPNRASGFFNTATRSYLFLRGTSVVAEGPYDSSTLPDQGAYFRFRPVAGVGWALRNDAESRFLQVSSAGGVSASAPAYSWEASPQEVLRVIEVEQVPTYPNQVMAHCSAYDPSICLQVTENLTFEVIDTEAESGDAVDEELEWEKIVLPDNKMAYYHPRTRSFLTYNSQPFEVFPTLHLLNDDIPVEATFEEWSNQHHQFAMRWRSQTEDRLIAFDGQDWMDTPESSPAPVLNLWAQDDMFWWSWRGSRASLLLGKEECPLQSPIRITLHQGPDQQVRRLTNYEDPPPEEGGIDVNGGEFQAHGVAYSPLWTRLAMSAQTGDLYIYVMDLVNWDPGLWIAITTSERQDDPTYTQNEERMIVEVKRAPQLGESVSSIRLDMGLEHKHWGGQDYQSEVALLTHSVTIEGEAPPVRRLSQVECLDLNTPSGQSPFPCEDATAGTGGFIHVTEYEDSVEDVLNHTIEIPGIAKLSGVELAFMGQTNKPGRNPLYLDGLGNKGKHSYIRGSSIHHSYYRAVGLHATSGAKVTENVAFDITGHGIYLESGVEENNEITHNLVAYVHSLGPVHHDYDGGADWVAASPSLADPSDTTASPFFISNLHNDIRGNAASGGWAGFLFPPYDEAKNAGKLDDGSKPRARPTLRFEGNSAHSTGYRFHTAAGFFFGGSFRKNFTEYNWDVQTFKHEACSSKVGRGEVCPKSNLVNKKFENNKVFLASRGFQSWGGMHEINRLELHDVLLGVSIDGIATIRNWLSVAWGAHQARFGQGCKVQDRRTSWRECAKRDWIFRQGYKAFQVKGEGNLHIIADSEFRGYDDSAEPSDDDEENVGISRCTDGPRHRKPNGKCRDTVVWEVVSVDDGEQPGVAQSTKNIKYSKCNKKRLFSYAGYGVDMDLHRNTDGNVVFYGDDHAKKHGAFERGAVASGLLRNVLDKGGNLLPENHGRRTLLGSSWANDWYRFNDKCHKTSADMPDMIACPLDEKMQSGRRLTAGGSAEVERYTLGAFRALVDPKLDDYIGDVICSKNHPKPCPGVGYVTHGNRPRASRGLALAAHNAVTGIVDSLEGIWYMRWTVGAPKRVEIQRLQLSIGAKVVLALPYPKSMRTSEVTVRAGLRGNTACQIDFHSVTTLQAVRDAPDSDAFHWDSSLGILYVGLEQKPDECLTVAGVAGTFERAQLDDIEMVAASADDGYTVTIETACTQSGDDDDDDRIPCQDADMSVDQATAEAELTVTGVLSYPGHTPYWKLDHDPNCVLTADPTCLDVVDPVPAPSAWRSVAIYSRANKCFLAVDPDTRNFTSMPADNASDFNSSWLETVFEIVYDGNEFLGFYSEVGQGFITMTADEEELSLSSHEDKMTLSETMSDQLFEIIPAGNGEVAFHSRTHMRYWALPPSAILEKIPFDVAPLGLHDEWTWERFEIVELSTSSVLQSEVLIKQNSLTLELSETSEDQLLKTSAVSAEFDIVSNGLGGEFEGVGLYHRGLQRFLRMVDWSTMHFSEVVPDKSLQHWMADDTFKKVVVGVDQVAFYNTKHERFLSTQLDPATGNTKLVSSGMQSWPATPQAEDLFNIVPAV